MNPLASPRAGVAAVWLAISALLAACGGGGGGDAPPPPNIGPAGGTVSTADGSVTLTVPPGAVSSPVRVALVLAPNTPRPDDPDVLPSTVVRIEGDGGALATAARLSFKLPPNAVAPSGAGTRVALAAGRARPLDYFSPGSPCDRDGDGFVSPGEEAFAIAMWQISLASIPFFDWPPKPECYVPPKLVAITPAIVELMGVCVPGTDLTAECTLSTLAARAVALKVDTQAPKVTIARQEFPTAPTPVTEARSYQFGVTATDNRGVVRVEFAKLKARQSSVLVTPLATVTSPPYVANIPLGPDDADVNVIVARAYDAWGNVGFASVGVKVQIADPPPPDTTPPTVTLGASATTAVVGAGITLTAAASDDVAVAKVEFLRNGSKIGEDTSAPYEFAPPAFTGADVGTIAYTARAVDTAGNSADSAAVNVSVSNPAAPGAYVSPTGDDNAAGTSAAPLRTLAKAFTVAGPNGTVWLQNGVFTPATEGLAAPDVPVGRTLPAGATLRAVNDGGATVAFTIQAPAGGSIVGLNFDTSSWGRVLATGGTLSLQRPQWVQLAATTLGQGLVASGSAKVTLDPKGNPAHNYGPAGLTGFVQVDGSAELTVDGGVLDGSTGQAGAFLLDGTAKLTVLNFTLANTSGAWVGGNGAIWPTGTANQVWVENTTIDLAGAGGVCVLQDRQTVGSTVVTTAITLKNVALKRCGGGPIQLREGAPVLTLENVVIEGGGRYGIEVGQVGSDSTVLQYARPSITASNLSVTGVSQGAVLMNNGGSLSINGGTLNGGTLTALQLTGARPYQLTLRNTTVLGTGTLPGVILQGDATASFDLGTAAQPGGNKLQAGNTSLRLSTAAGVLTTAVGNTWKPNVQGASASGTYSSTSIVCGGATPCDVTAGGGGNYSFQDAGAGAVLRLVGP